MESHIMASENAEEQVSQKRSQRFGTGTLLRIAKKVLYRFQGSLRPELYLDNCTENDFEQRPVGREEIIGIWKHIEMKNL